jgi:hypothetical protein
MGCSVWPALAVLLAGKAKFSKGRGYQLRQGQTPKMSCNDRANTRSGAARFGTDVRSRRSRNVANCFNCVAGE